MEKRILLASPRGFCFGVGRAIEMLEETVKQESGRVYVRKEIVHNTAVVEHFKSLGVVIVNEVDEVPQGGIVVFSAHGVAPSVRESANARNLTVVDTTCPLVTKIHKEALRFKSQEYTIILIGEAGHKEMIGVIGEAPDHIRFIQREQDVDKLTGIDGSRVAWLSQTTLNVDETQQIVKRLQEKFPHIQGPPKSDICYATKNRQWAVKSIANECDLFVVVGSENSSNTRRLVEVAHKAGAVKVIRIDEPADLSDTDFTSVYTVGVTSGVSTTDDQLQRILTHLKGMGYSKIEERVAVEESNFAPRQ